MSIKLLRYSSLISKSNPVDLEQAIRGLIIHYFFHVSHKHNIEIIGVDPKAPKTLNILTPTVFKGRGKFKLASTAVFGWVDSPGSCSSSYIESRFNESADSTSKCN